MKSKNERGAYFSPYQQERVDTEDMSLKDLEGPLAVDGCWCEGYLSAALNKEPSTPREEDQTHPGKVRNFPC